MTILSAILPIFILIGIGVVLQKILPRQPESSRLMCQIGLGSCETWTTVLNKFALYLALPALIFSSLVETQTTQLLPASLVLFTIIAMIGMIGLVYLVTTLLGYSSTLRNTYVFNTFFGNIAYIGPPFLVALYGTDILGAISISIAIHVAIAFSIGLILLERSKHHDHIDWSTISSTLIRNPLLLSVFLGLLFLFLSIPIPSTIIDALTMLGATSSPVILIALGTFIATEWDPRVHLGHMIVITSLKLFIIPLICLFFLAMYYTPNVFRDITLLQIAMPVAVSNFALAEAYPMDKKITANVIILSVLVSVCSLSLFSLVLS